MKRINIFLIIVSAFLFSCSSEHNSSAGIDKLKQEAQIIEKLTNPDEIYYEDVLQLVLKNNCTSCHSSSEKKGEVDVSTYQATLGVKSKKSVVPFQPNKSTMYETLILKSGKRKMPPIDEPQLSDQQIDLVFQWINGGAKKRGQKTSKRPKSLNEQLEPYFESPETIDFKLVNELVFKKNCLDCHSYDGSKADEDGAIIYGQDMSDYKAILNGGIVPGKLTGYVVSVDGNLKKKKGSRIYESTAVTQTMPPTAEGYLPVDSLYVKLVRLWIENCAIEDYDAIKGNDELIEEDDRDTPDKVRDCD